MQTRESFIKVRVKDDERIAWQAQAKASHMTLSNFIRTKIGSADLVSRDPKITKPCRRADPELIQSLGRIGSNLNQIAKWANIYKSEAEAVLVIAALVSIDAKLSAPEKKIYKKNKVDENVS